MSEDYPQRVGDCLHLGVPDPEQWGGPTHVCDGCGTLMVGAPPFRAAITDRLAAVEALLQEWDRANLLLPDYPDEPAADASYRAGVHKATQLARDELRAVLYPPAQTGEADRG